MNFGLEFLGRSVDLQSVSSLSPSSKCNKKMEHYFFFIHFYLKIWIEMLLKEFVASTFASLLFCSCNVLACYVIFTTKNNLYKSQSNVERRNINSSSQMKTI